MPANVGKIKIGYPLFLKKFKNCLSAKNIIHLHLNYRAVKKAALLILLIISAYAINAIQGNGLCAMESHTEYSFNDARRHGILPVYTSKGELPLSVVNGQSIAGREELARTNFKKTHGAQTQAFQTAADRTIIAPASILYASLKAADSRVAGYIMFGALLI